MKRFLFNIIKVFMFIVFQYSIIMGYCTFGLIVGDNFYYDYEILYWVISISAFLLGEGAIFLICTAKPLEKTVPRMRGRVFNIIKLFMSMVLQCYMILACPWFLSDGWSCKDIINKVITLLAILSGEGGIYLLYTVKPLENEKQNKVYAKAYIGINIIFFGILMYACLSEGLI